jgi:hypothetical protein
MSSSMLAPDQPEHYRRAGVLVDLMGQARREDLSLPLPGDPRARAAALRLQNAPGDANDLAKPAVDGGTKRADDLLVTARVKV